VSRWRDLPSLSLLRAFDATAKHGSFAEAGRVLNVTHAAVTQAVRALEAELGVPLVRRSGRTVALTDAGAQLAQSLDAGFSTLAEGIAALRQREARRVLRVATTTFIAEVHVMPRLPAFWAKHPGVEVAMSPSPALADFERDGFDMAIRVLADGWTERPDQDVRLLKRTPVIAVAAPALARSGATPQDIPWVMGADSPWEHEQLRHAGLDLDRLNRVKLGSPHLEMSATRQGLGAMLATEIICLPDLEAGRLEVLPVTGLPSVTYAVVLPKGPRRAAVDQFADWLATIF
jgi:LysR family glycine cleavage system transcriptional activator